jgi:hypothetical protein
MRFVCLVLARVRLRGIGQLGCGGHCYSILRIAWTRLSYDPWSHCRYISREGDDEISNDYSHQPTQNQ